MSGRDGQIGETSAERQQPLWWTAANCLAAFAAIGLMSVRLVGSARTNVSWSYPAGEWLINYGSGPVRRGLGGELIQRMPFVSELWGLHIVVLGLFVTVCIGAVLLVTYTMTAVRNPYPLLFWAVPGGPLMGAGQTLWLPMPEEVSLFEFRKEYLGYAILIVLSVVVIRWRGQVAGHLVLVAGLAGVTLGVAALIHEAIAAATAVSVCLVLGFAVAPTTWRSRCLAFCAVIVPTLIGVLFAWAHPGGPGSAVPVWAAMEPATQAWMGQTIPGAVTFIEWSTGDAVRFTQENVYVAGNWQVWLLMAGASIGFTVLLTAVADSRRHSRSARAVTFVVLILAALPLFIVAVDTGRWISLICVLGLIVMFTDSACEPSGTPLRARTWARVAIWTLLVVTVVVGLPEAGNPPSVLWQ